MIAVIAFGRISGVMRDVRTPNTGPLTSGVNSTATKSASVKTHVGRSRPSSHSGSETPRMAPAASRRGWVLGMSMTAMIVPTSAPAPSAL